MLRLELCDEDASGASTRTHPEITKSFCFKVELKLRSEVEFQNCFVLLSIGVRPLKKTDLQG